MLPVGSPPTQASSTQWFKGILHHNLQPDHYFTNFPPYVHLINLCFNIGVFLDYDILWQLVVHNAEKKPLVFLDCFSSSARMGRNGESLFLVCFSHKLHDFRTPWNMSQENSPRRVWNSKNLEKK